MERPHALLRDLRDSLPRGERLPLALWNPRHRAMVQILRLHIPALLIWGLLKGYPVLHAAADIVPLLLPAWLAGVTSLTRRGREICTTVGLLTASAIVIHLMDGAIEAHFHFFVMVSILALYEEWFPFLLAMGFVLVHHGVMSAVSSTSVFNHPAALDHPWRWAAIHSIFIGAQGAVSVVSWRVNEQARDREDESRERFGSAFTDAPIPMALVGLDGRILQANAELDRRWTQAVGDGRRIAGRPLAALVHTDDLDRRDFPGYDAVEVRHGDQSGWGAWHHAPLRNAAGVQSGWISHCIDVSERRQLEHDLIWCAEHDPLTGLSNRRQLVRSVDRLVADGNGLTLLFLDVDDFKVINDSLGHEEGDLLLRELGCRLDGLAREHGGMAARFGGDEFVLIAPGVTASQAVDDLACRLCAVVAEPVALAGDMRSVHCSVGVRICAPHEAITTEGLVRDADLAMYHAKGAGKAGAARFDEQLRDGAARRITVEDALRGVVERGELTLVYQPLVALGLGQIDGVEALLRWSHPDLGLVGPDEFIPIAEQCGDIVAIGAWVLDAACAQLRAWDRPGLHVAVNVSSRQLVEPGFVRTVECALFRHGIPAASLCLEVTETAVLGDATATRSTLAALAALGVQLAVDDFGVGYASLMHLRQLLPLNTLKVDKSFVDGVLEGAEDAAIVAGVIRLAHSLGMSVVAEGVEHAAQAEQLHRWGCEIGQGYYFSRPAAPDVIAELLRRGDAPSLRVA
jgi:diguanylate cyclase (GGDEF)-like protein